MASAVAEQEEDATRRIRVAQGGIGGDGCHPAVQHAAAEVEAGEVRDAAIIQALGALGPARIENAPEAAQHARQTPGVQRSRPAKGDEGKPAQIMPLLHGDQP